MDTLPLPPRPNLSQYRKRAKALVAAVKSADPAALRTWASEWRASLVEQLPRQPTPFVQGSIDRAVARMIERARGTPAGTFTLANAHFIIADAHGFANWSAFVRHVDDASGARAADGFEDAADAVVAGALDRLGALLRADPDLIRARSSRVHHATLLHYVAANGVEDFRQRTPANAVDMARTLLDAGAQVDALAHTYDGGWWQTTMNLLVSSAHPAGAGVQPALVEVLADYGAAVNGLKDDESPLMTALDFGYLRAAEALVKRGARLDTIATAAALGRTDLVKAFVVDSRTIRAGVPLLGPPWRRLPPEPKAHIELALAWACKFAHPDTADFLVELGVSPAAMDGHRMTALHWATANGLNLVIDKLLARGAPLEAKNAWDGTVLGSTAHFAVHDPRTGVDYMALLERLIGRGADAAAAYPSGSAAIDALLKRSMR